MLGVYFWFYKVVAQTRLIVTVLLWAEPVRFLELFLLRACLLRVVSRISPKKKVGFYISYVWFGFIVGRFLKFLRVMLWIHCYLIFILSITARQCHNSQSVHCASQSQSHKEFLHYCIPVDGHVFNHHVSSLLACMLFPRYWDSHSCSVSHD